MRLNHLLILATVVMTAGILYMTRPNRNVRNNNPLNIRESADWEGERIINADAAFEEFKSPKWGFRAAYIILLQYLERGQNTIYEIVAGNTTHSGWAPASDNNHVGNYTDYLSEQMGINKYQQLEVSDLPALMLHMSNFEGGQGHFTMMQIIDGLALAHKEDFVIARLGRMGVEVVA